MKKISARQLAFSYPGVFLGAGFVSGQELWQFFGCFGAIGLVGFLCATAIFFLVNYSVMRLVQTTGQGEMGRLMTLGDHPKLRVSVNVMQCVLLFGVGVIMIAGAGSLAQQMIALPAWLAGALFTLIVILVALLGMQGLVAVFSFVVPATTVCAVILGAVILFRCGFHFPAGAGSATALVPNWLVGFPTYAAYNLFGVISVLTPMAAMVPEARTLRRGLTFGTGILIVMAGSIIAAMAAVPSAGLAELPMAVLAGQIHPLLSAGYGVLMLLGMFTAALSTMTAIVNQLAIRWRKAAMHHRLFTTVLLVIAYLLSLLGFGNLIGVVYPIFGYLSIPFLCCIVINWCREWKKQKEAIN